jgi:transcriptional regulator with GAF, ATPase, and Fis domain
MTTPPRPPGPARPPSPAATAGSSAGPVTIGSAPSGSRPAPPTEVITRESGPSVRRVRKLRVSIVACPDASLTGEAFTFAEDEVRIGSGEACDVTVNDPAVSREHVAVRLEQDGWSVHDLGSTNGTFVGELRLGKVTITDKLTLELGKTTLALAPLAESVEQELSPRPSFHRMLGASPAMRQTFATLEKVAKSDLTVLIEGETGTGKELAAEGLHDDSERPGRFVALNCGAIPRELLESELFGHKKGAFSGAVNDRTGAMLAADKGTLFLDEVGELPLDMQAKVLRTLERREVKPVGSDKTLSVDVRIVAATNRSLPKEVEAGRFRQDLYYRLAVVVVRLPPLRTRKVDLPMLVDHFQDELARRRAAQGLAPLPRLDDAALAMLARYDFPGNVRELRNVVERWAVLGAPPAELEPASQRGGSASGPHDRASGAEASARGAGGAGGADSGAARGELAEVLRLPYHEAKDLWNDRFDRAFVEHALRESGGNVSKAARDAGVDRRHLQRLMARFGVRSSE